MTKQEKAALVAKTLDKLYPRATVPLDHTDPYTLLVAVVLSAQCTDKKVNEVTPELFAKAGTPKRMAALPVEEILRIIRPCGLSPTKSRNIHALSQIIQERHHGKVPHSFEELEALPGVGHKSASVVMAQGFGVPAFPVDTHIHRLAWRWGLSNGKNVEQTEKDLKRLFPEKAWNKIHLQIIHFGREHCPAKKHDPRKCPICSKIGRRELFGG